MINKLSDWITDIWMKKERQSKAAHKAADRADRLANPSRREVDLGYVEVAMDELGYMDNVVPITHKVTRPAPRPAPSRSFDMSDVNIKPSFVPQMKPVVMSKPANKSAKPYLKPRNGMHLSINHFHMLRGEPNSRGEYINKGTQRIIPNVFLLSVGGKGMEDAMLHFDAIESPVRPTFIELKNYPAAIAHCLQNNSRQFQKGDIVMIVRGGGDTDHRQFDMYRNLESCEAVQELVNEGVHVVTGIGHYTDHFKLQDYATHAAGTPTAASDHVHNMVMGVRLNSFLYLDARMSNTRTMSIQAIQKLPHSNHATQQRRAG